MNDSTLKPGDTLGLIGGGQLGRMFTQAAQRMGFQVAVIDPDRHCPAAQVGAIPITGRWDDRQTLEKLAQISKATTVEFENIFGSARTGFAKSGFSNAWDALFHSGARFVQNRTWIEPPAPWACP